MTKKQDCGVVGRESGRTGRAALYRWTVFISRWRQSGGKQVEVRCVRWWWAARGPHPRIHVGFEGDVVMSPATETHRTKT